MDCEDEAEIKSKRKNKSKLADALLQKKPVFDPSIDDIF